MTGPASALLAMSEAIQLYADAAYPLGGSECAQAARAGLLDTVEKINVQVSQQQNPVTISRRIKTHIKSAIQYYHEVNTEENELSAQRCRVMLAMLNGENIQDNEWP